MPGPEAVAVVPALRVVADPAVLDGALARALGARLADLGARVLRLAPDDLLVLAPGPRSGVLRALHEEILDLDHHAIVTTEAGFAGVWWFTGHVRRWVAANADWLLPDGDGLSQGQVAGLPVKILVDGDDALVLVPTPIAHELAPRLPAEGRWPA